jgi:hypothetical protein
MEQLFLVLRGTPAAFDIELDPVVRAINCSSAQGTEESGMEVGYTRNLVIKDRRAVGDCTVSLAERTTGVQAKRPRQLPEFRRAGRFGARH